MDPNAFKHARLKLERAKFHINDLDREITEFFSREPYLAYLSERKTDTQIQVTFSTYTREAPPECLALILGDAVHNLRVALDVSANALVALSNFIPKGVHFPFGTDSVHFEQQMKDKMKGASAEAKDLVRALKPYKGGNDALRALHDMDIVDKHSAPLECSHLAQSPAMTVKGIGTPEGVGFDYPKDEVRPMDHSLFPEPISPPDGYTFVGMVDATNTLVLAKQLPLGEQPIIEVLNNFVEMVDGILETFETHFFGKKA